MVWDVETEHLSSDDAVLCTAMPLIAESIVLNAVYTAVKISIGPGLCVIVDSIMTFKGIWNHDCKE